MLQCINLACIPGMLHSLLPTVKGKRTTDPISHSNFLDVLVSFLLRDASAIYLEGSISHQSGGGVFLFFFTSVTKYLKVFSFFVVQNKINC